MLLIVDVEVNIILENLLFLLRRQHLHFAELVYPVILVSESIFFPQKFIHSEEMGKDNDIMTVCDTTTKQTI